MPLEAAWLLAYRALKKKISKKLDLLLLNYRRRIDILHVIQIF